MAGWCATLLGWLVVPIVVQSKLLSNSIVGVPTVNCGEQLIMAQVQTKEPFHGRIFMKGNSHLPDCVQDYTRPVAVGGRPDAAGDGGGNGTVMEVPIYFTQCNTQRTRTLVPSGVTFANTVVIQFHKTFITQRDKVYHIRCFYSEAPKTVSANINVSQMTPSQLSDQMEMPSCSYTVRQHSPNGPVVRNAKVGDMVFHKWECRGNNHAFGMLVHSCYVGDTQGETSQILDEVGCALDSVLLPNLKYSDDLAVAYQETQVFKYPDHSFVHFKCQIKICTKMDNGCSGISPPSCSQESDNNNLSERAKRRVTFASEPVTSLRMFNTTPSASHDSLSLSASTGSLDVDTPRILVLDEADADNTLDAFDISQSGSASLSAVSSLEDIEDSFETIHGLMTSADPSWQLCVNRTVMASVLIGFILLFAGALAFVVYVLFRNSQQSKAKSGNPALD